MTEPSPCPAASPHPALQDVAARGMRHAEFESVQAVALAVWYGSTALDLATLNGPHATEAALLVERLGFYNVVPQPRKRELRAVTAPLLVAVDPAARAEFEKSYKAVLARLQPLQTRHYAARESLAHWGVSEA